MNGYKIKSDKVGFGYYLKYHNTIIYYMMCMSRL